MELRNRATGDIITDAEFRQSFPNVSFPQTIKEDILNSFGYDPVFNGPEVSFISRYETCERDGVYEDNGKWYTKYVVGPVFKEYIDEEGTVHTVEKQKQEHRLRVDAKEAENVRNIRNGLLSTCDWTQLVDSTLKEEIRSKWSAYRQQLRDVSLQNGFPWDIEWPVLP